MNRRLQDERLADWLDGRLDGVARERFEAEMRADRELRAAADEYRRTVDALRAGLAGGPRPQHGFADRVMAAAAAGGAGRGAPRLRLLPWLGSAAAAAALVAAFFAVRGLGDGARAPDVEQTAAGAARAPEDRGMEFEMRPADDAGTRLEFAETLEGAAPEAEAVRRAGLAEDELARVDDDKREATDAVRPGANLRARGAGPAGSAEPGPERARAKGGGVKGDPALAGVAATEGANGPPTPGAVSDEAPKAMALGGAVPSPKERDGEGAREDSFFGSFSPGVPAAVGPVVYVVELRDAGPTEAGQGGRTGEPGAAGRPVAGESAAPARRGGVTVPPADRDPGLAQRVERLVRLRSTGGDAGRGGAEVEAPVASEDAAADAAPELRPIDLAGVRLAFAPAAESAVDARSTESAEPAGPPVTVRSLAGPDGAPGLYDPRPGDLAFEVTGAPELRDAFLRGILARVAADGAQVRLQRAPWLDRATRELLDRAEARARLDADLPASDVLIVFRRAPAGR